MPTLSGLQMKTWTDSLALKLLSNFVELYSKCFELHNYARDVARNLILVGINGSRRQNNHIKQFKVD